MTDNQQTREHGPLQGVRVVEIGDVQGEYCGLVLAGLGAEVIKVEPPGGSVSRSYGPFAHDAKDPNSSLFFWAYNRGKESIVLDLESAEGLSEFLMLTADADIIIDSTPHGYLPSLGAGPDELRKRDPKLIFARISPFGDYGPRRDWKASDLVHLALGGVVMNCGYDPKPNGEYDLPPIAPQAAHSYAIAGEQVAFTAVAALLHRDRTGEGQYLSCAIHEAVAKNTEGDLMSWIALRTPFLRQTCRHSTPSISRHRSIVPTKDGRWVLAVTRDSEVIGPFLEKYGIGGDLRDSVGDAEGTRVLPGTEKGSASNMDVIEQSVRRYLYADVPWREAQSEGLMWVPVRKPHENAIDEHWLARSTYADVYHPEFETSFRYPTSKWLSNGPAWVEGRRPPLLDEDHDRILARTSERRPQFVHPTVPQPGALSVHGKPFALKDVRILDFTWFLASAGATRFLAALGADVIKVEWHKNIDPRRGGSPEGGRAAREIATGPVPSRWPADLGGPHGAQYNNKNPGKRAISLNVKHPKGLELAKMLAAECNMVTEGFSPGVMESWGLGYDELRKVNPSIIYGKQSGMGTHGIYGRFRTVGPVAQAFTGISEMSGLPDPLPPAGWGYSFLDWYGAYSFALALLTAVYHRDKTGEGQAIDASQCEVGLFLASVPTLDWSVNNREWQRAGNRSPYTGAAPEGIFRCAGDDRWIAISCNTEEEWQALARVIGRDEWLVSEHFATRELRRENASELDRQIQEWTMREDPFEAMSKLQGAGVPAGVAQTAEDRVENDPQLAALNWLTELDATDFGRWPVAETSVKMSETPQHIGGPVDRGAPTYGEFNYEVYGELLGLTPSEVDALAEEGAL